MDNDLGSLNGSGYCRYENTQLHVLNEHLKHLNKITEDRDEWIKGYIDRSMPMKSHFWILLGSLSILSAFAAVMRYLEKLNF